MLLKVEGIVIRSMDYGENNIIISLYTRERGKISAMVRGAKKMSSRFASTTQLFTYGEFIVFKSGQMGTLNSCELIESHHKLREDLTMAAYSSYMAELYERIMPEQEEGNNYFFEQLKAGLSAIEEGKEPSVVLHIIEMKMLEISGYLPQLDCCVICGNDLGEMVLSVRNGGLLCSQSPCRLSDPESLLLTEATIKMLRLFLRMDLRRLGLIQVKANTKAQLKISLRALMDTYIDVRWKSRRFIDQMEKYQL